jgi:hypothetical protein
VQLFSFFCAKNYVFFAKSAVFFDKKCIFFHKNWVFLNPSPLPPHQCYHFQRRLASLARRCAPRTPPPMLPLPATARFARTSLRPPHPPTNASTSSDGSLRSHVAGRRMPAAAPHSATDCSMTPRRCRHSSFALRDIQSVLEPHPIRAGHRLSRLSSNCDPDPVQAAAGSTAGCTQTAGKTAHVGDHRRTSECAGF